MDTSLVSPNNSKAMDMESTKELLTIKKARTTPLASKMKKKSPPKTGLKLKKAPGAPRRFKTAFIFFSTQKHKEFREALGKRGSQKVKATNIAKMVSKAWKNLSKEERAVWDEIAAKDKARYELERSTYTGPWQVIDTGRDPMAPRRPCSAFINFLNFKRDEVKKEHPMATSIEVMRITAKLWRENAPERELFEARAVKDRENYRKEMEQWKEMQQRKPEAVLASKREEMAWSALEGDNGDSQHHDGQGLTEEELIVAVSKLARARADSSGINDQRGLPPVASPSIIASSPAPRRGRLPNLPLSCTGNDALSRMRASSVSSRFNQMTNRRNFAHPVLSQQELAASDERILRSRALLQQQQASNRLLQQLSSDPLMMVAKGLPSILPPPSVDSLATPAINRELALLLDGLRRERELLTLELLERRL